jgi:uncharacterized protein YndB with AHSA1/START domain
MNSALPQLLQALAALLVGLVGIVVVGGLVLPNDYDVARVQVIGVPQAAAFEFVADVEQFERWQPWTERDPTMRMTLGEPRRGVGAHLTWTSERAGQGKLETIVFEPPNRLVQTLSFGGDTPTTAEWTFEEEDGFTTVTWALRGTSPGILGGWRTMALEAPLEADLSDGLARLRDLAEAPSSE